MIRQVMTLPCDWDVLVFYGVKPDDEFLVMDNMRAAGCTDETVGAVQDSFASGSLSASYSNTAARESAVVLGSQPRESFRSRLDKEKHKLVDHIAEALDMDTEREEYMYLRNFIDRKVSCVSKLYM